MLSLRNFGASRTLVLLDGHRVAPSNQDGTLNVDILPQMLVSRVDIVTGGASAVYGSDAVAGVVNFVLDKKFTGFRFNVDAGISMYGDGGEGQIAAAWGTELFDGRGHFETSARYRDQAQIPISARSYGEDGQQWVLTGNGSAANPFRNTPYARLNNAGMVGLVFNCGAACTANGTTFGAPGVLRPFLHGTPTGTGTIESGGDGAYIPYGTFRSGISMQDWFGRFSYDLTDDTSAYVQASWAKATNTSQLGQLDRESGCRPSGHLLCQQSLPERVCAAAAGWQHRVRHARRYRLALPAVIAGSFTSHRIQSAVARGE